MSDHPLRTYARDASTTLAEIAAKAGTSRQTLHRIMRGENSTLEVLRRISAATGGTVSVAVLADPPALDVDDAEEEADRLVASSDLAQQPVEEAAS